MANKLQPLLTLSQAKELVAFLEADNTKAANEVVEQAVKMTSGVDVFDKVRKKILLSIYILFFKNYFFFFMVFYFFSFFS